MRLLLFPLLITLGFHTQAQAPTQAASDLLATNITCHTAQLNWTNGNGSSRVVLIKETSSFTKTPQDNEFYQGNPNFGDGDDLGGDNTHFCIYNGTGTTVTVKGLRENSLYYVAVFEYNGGAGNTEYLTSAYPEVNVNTKNIKAEGYLITSGSLYNRQTAQCLNGNRFDFKNKSVSDLAPLTYSWTFGDGDNSTLAQPSHSYKAAGIYQVTLTATAPGCKASNTFADTVQPHPVVRFSLNPFISGNDSIQCFVGNHFTFRNQSILESLGGLSSMRYNWYENEVLFSTSYKNDPVFTTSGVKKIKLVATSNFGCADSTQKTYEVVQLFSPANIRISPKSSVLKNNRFVFVNRSSKAFGKIWYLSKKNSSFRDTLRGDSVTYSFNETGLYYVRIEAADSAGHCSDRLSDSVEVLANVGVKENDPLTGLRILPNPSRSGMFYVQALLPQTEIRIYDALGEEILQVSSEASVTGIDLSAKPTGIYTVIFHSEGKMASRRIQIVR